jgi:hypothetical protein
MWTVRPQASGNFALYESNSGAVYPAGTLYKNVTVDEKNDQVIEFKDKEGMVILKKVQLENSTDNGTGSDHANWLCTYYLYDDLNRLSCVIQPKGVALIEQNNWQLNDPDILAELCFQYEYDERNNMVRKQVPGAGVVSMVYDQRERLVLTQDAKLMEQGKWLYTQYDEFNRPITTGLWGSNFTWAEHILLASTSTNYPDLSSQTVEELTRTFYDDYSWRSGYGNPLSDNYIADFETYFLGHSNTVWPYPQQNELTNQLKNLVTGTRIKVLGTSNQYLFTVNFYDKNYRMVQMQSQNITGGYDVSTTQYSWNGKPLIVIQKQENNEVGPQEAIVVTKYTYDELGRLSKTEKKAGLSGDDRVEMPSSYKLLSNNEYDKLGQLKQKKIASSASGTSALENLTYDYNIRGWLLGINKDYIRNPNNSNYFGFELAYDDKDGMLLANTYLNSQYNGNITGTSWKSQGDGAVRKFDFTYDKANRLTGADFSQYKNNTFINDPYVNFDVSGLQYDRNGNILAMKQMGLKSSTSGVIDELQYRYLDKSNKLISVSDNNYNDPNNGKFGDFKDGNNVLTDDYSFDLNGNMNEDKNNEFMRTTNTGDSV